MEVVRRLRRLVDSMDDSVLNPSYKKRRGFLRRSILGQVSECFADCRERLARDHLPERRRLSLVHRRMKDSAVICAPDA